jgi:hypothetical protein
MITREYTDKLTAEVDEKTNSAVWSRSRIFKCPECGTEQEIVFTSCNDPKTYYDATDGAEESYLNVTLGGLCNQCEQKIYSELVEVEKTRGLTEREEFYKRRLAPEEHEKIWTIDMLG